MLLRWFNKFALVHIAKTRAEREAIYRFRYDVYVKGMNIQNHPLADHEQKSLTDPDDESPTSSHFFTGDTSNITSAVRVRNWLPGQIPEDMMERYSMDILPGIEQMRVADISRMMIRPTLRGKLLYPSLVLATFEDTAGTHSADLVFLYCVPGLVTHYLNHGARLYSARISAMQTMVPMVMVMSDYALLKEKGSLLAPISKQYYGEGKNRILDLEPLRHVFDTSHIAVTLDQDEVRDDVAKHIEEMEFAPKIFHNISKAGMDNILRAGFVLDVEADSIMTNHQFYDQEVYLILKGEFEAMVNDQHLWHYQPGEVFGVLAFFAEDGLRGASVVARTNGKVLVLRRKFLARLAEKSPKEGFMVLMNLSRIMAERLRLEFERSTLTERLANFLIGETMDTESETHSRIFFDRRMEDEVLRAKRYHRAISIVIAKVTITSQDEANQIIETTKEVLAQVVEAITKVLRSGDILARFGPSSLAVIALETDSTQADKVSSRIRSAVEDQRFTVDETEFEITLTLGVATQDVGDADKSCDEFVNTAASQAGVNET